MAPQVLLTANKLKTDRGQETDLSGDIAQIRLCNRSYVQQALGFDPIFVLGHLHVLVRFHKSELDFDLKLLLPHPIPKCFGC